ncbi:MAG: 6-bladed beta-propeller [Thermoplasmata archaeon]
MNKGKAIILLSVLLLGGCATTRPITSPDGPDLVWPEPPDPPRIRFLYSLTRPDDLGITKGFFQRLWEFFAGKRLEQVEKPYGVAAEGERIYITDQALRVIHIFDLEAGSYGRVERAGDRYFEALLGIAVDGDGRFYVSDPDASRLYLFDEDGELLRSADVGEAILRPTGLAFDRARGLLYVVDTLGHKVVILDRDFQRRGEIGRRGERDGEFNFPTHAFVRKDGRLYVADTFNFRVQAFAPDGTYLFKFGRVGNSLASFAQPKGIAVDSEGHIYVVEGRLNVIKVFDSGGQLLLVLGGLGAERGRFWLPTGLYIDAADRIYVADSFNQRVQVFQYLREQP